jgi:hypothetical protein
MISALDPVAQAHPEDVLAVFEHDAVWIDGNAMRVVGRSDIPKGTFCTVVHNVVGWHAVPEPPHAFARGSEDAGHPCVTRTQEHGPSATGADGPCDPGCVKCANAALVMKSPEDTPELRAALASLGRSAGPFITVQCFEYTPEQRERIAALKITDLRRRLCLPDIPTNPLDVEYDGVTLRALIERSSMIQREQPDAIACEDRHRAEPERYRPLLTAVQRAAVSAHWSAELRAKVAASKAADKEREDRRVLVDLEEW